MKLKPWKLFFKKTFFLRYIYLCLKILFREKNITAIFIKKKIVSDKSIYRLKQFLSSGEIKNLNINNNFQYIIDINYSILISKRILGNMPFNYAKAVNQDCVDFQDLSNIKGYNKKDLKKLNQIFYKYHKEMKIDKNKMSLHNALQTILFWNQILWQTQHRLSGLGRLDQILYPFINKEENMEKEISDFCKILHEYYIFKSNVMQGDTGQIIILGGTDSNGEYQCNELTYLFMKVIIQLQLPDPKLLLRVSKNMPRDLLELAVSCIATGCGSPILSNDDVVIDCLTAFGYSREDASDYAVSACWEPLIPGKSLEQNNIGCVVFPQPLVEIMHHLVCKGIETFELFIKKYSEELVKHVNNILDDLDRIEWDKDPIFSLFTNGCIESKKDISQGGAVYNNYGILSVGIGNTVNSLLNIQKYVYLEKLISLDELSEAMCSNYENRQDLLSLFNNAALRFGNDDEKVISLTNQLMDIVESVICLYTNPLGGKVKVGYSSPSYLTIGNLLPATCDGRLKGEPLSAHISADGINSYTEIINFASKLNYSGYRSNGNVVDIMTYPELIKNNYSKFVDFIEMSIESGFFQLQFNVVLSKTLQEAKIHPDLFKSLIVRVWGFSAYFVDLPEEYQNMLIKRAQEGEGHCLA